MGENEQRLLRLLPLLRQIVTKVGVHQTRTGTDLGLTNQHLGALGTVSQHDNCTMRELAEGVSVAPPTATRIVNDLVEKELVERVSDPQDRRVVRIGITQKGRETIDQVHQEATDLVAQILERMSDGEQEALLVGLTSFIDALMADDRGDRT